jgi:curved DNA-binding protein CbpA
METAREMADTDPRIPRLATGWERRSAALSPREGFLLSRIDGRTSWTLLREIGGLPPEEVDRCLARWLDEGLLEVVEPARPAARRTAPEGGVDPGLDLAPERQQEILAFEAQLDRPYHELLGVGLDADERAIKRAYFDLSKKFHPDRYFRQRIGPFAERLGRIFKKLVEAYELLSDPSTRAELERSLAETRTPQPIPAPARAPSEAPGPRLHLERLRRMLRVPEKILAERKFKARQFFESYRVAAAQGRWLEAAASTRLAIAFDPGEAAYKQAFAEAQVHVHEIRAAELLEKTGGFLDASEQQEALRHCEEVIHYRPGNAALNHRAASLALELGEFEKAGEYAEAACEIEPEVCAHHVLLCRVLRRSGLPDRARKALQAAEQLDPKDADVVKERRALQRASKSR